MNKKKDDSLVIYKASAGSGKTFTLAINYIKLLIQSPSDYRSILAVTFTNKATEEMKLRILSQLYGIWKLLPDSKSYLDKITSELSISESYASAQAGIALSNLLHHYSYFRVETIDAFFQSILRNLARELDLTASLNIVLNDVQVEQQAVDELIESLTPASKVLKWIVSSIEQNISEDKSWNVIGQIKKFGENIFKDVYKGNYQLIHHLLESEHDYDAYVASLYQVKAEADKVFQEIVDGFTELLTQNGLEVTDFSRGTSGVCGYFKKLSEGKCDDDSLLNKTTKAGMEDPNTWVKKNEQVDGNHKYELVKNVLLPYLVLSEKKRKHHASLFKSAVITLKNLDKLRLLSVIEDKVRELNALSGRFLLSDTQMLLHSLVKDSDSPFIFEKIGANLEHIMIDEFQDTSTTQWNNFNVLLQECLSYPSSQSLIVGDVKQSIYRWRSGDWRLLNNIEKEFSSSSINFSVRSKKENYRSERNIVDFNNAFFTLAARFEYEKFPQTNEEETQQIVTAYSDVEQIIPGDKPCRGQVDVRLLPNEDYSERMLEQVGCTIDMLLSQGVSPQSIAIIARSNATISEVADYLLQTRPGITLISDEAFKLNASLAIHIIMDALTLLLHPTDRLTMASLVKAYQKCVLGNEVADESFLMRDQDLTVYLPQEFWQQHESLLSMPIYSLVELIYRTFELERMSEQSAYICTFYDLLGNFLTENSSDIGGLITEWEDNLKDKTIQSDELNGIRLITIHKSKGLEYDHVIIPFCDWKLESSNNVLWCQPTEAPFNAMPLIPINYSPKQMKGTVYEKDYLYEHLQNTVDNLNLLYVAFTRASKNLFIFGLQGSKEQRSYIIEQVLEQVHQSLPDSRYLSRDETDGKEILFQYGELYIANEESGSKETQNIFMAHATPFTLPIKAYPGKATFLQSNQSKDFLSGEDEADKKQEYISLGRILHQVFARIHTISDIDKVLKELEFDGLLYDNELTFERLKQLLHNRLNHPQVASWFDVRWKVFNECTILTVDAETDRVVEQRPDKVLMSEDEVIVIDFKFGNPREEYQDQVLRYMSLISSMGYQNVKGYLWFVYSNNIVEVK